MDNVLRCSSAGRWMRCALSAHLERHPDALIDEDQDAAEEGTCAAWVAEMVINGDATTPEDMVGRVHKNGIEVDEDMARHLTTYVDIARSLHHSRAEVYRAVKITPEWIVGGTLDLEGWSSPEDYHVVDLKYGFRVIEPTTDQIWAYAALAMTYGNSAARFHLTIYQPRAVHHAGITRTISVTRDQVEAYRDRMFARAMQIAQGAGDGNPTEYCMHCLGAAKCEALTQSVYAMWTPVRSRAILDPSDQQIADELAMLKQMQAMTDARRAAVEAEATERLRRGKMVPGWAMMPRPGQRKFKYPGDVVKAMTGVDPFEIKVCTPAELERRGAKADMVNALSTKPTVGYKLAPYDPRAVAALFGETKQ